MLESISAQKCMTLKHLNGLNSTRFKDSGIPRGLQTASCMFMEVSSQTLRTFLPIKLQGSILQGRFPQTQSLLLKSIINSEQYLQVTKLALMVHSLLVRHLRKKYWVNFLHKLRLLTSKINIFLFPIKSYDCRINFSAEIP